MQISLPQKISPSTPSDFATVLVEEITSLINRVNSTGSRFLEVKRNLDKTPFDAENNFDWYRKQYLELVWKSKEIAGKASVAGEDFCGDLLDLVLLNTNSSKEEKIRELEIAIESWNTDGERDLQLSHKFKDLSSTLKEFCTTLSKRIARANEAETRLSSEIDRLSADIAHIDVRGMSISEQLRCIFSWAIDMFQHRRGLGPAEASRGQRVTSKVDLMSQMAILEGEFRDIHLIIDKQDDILGQINAMTVDMDSIASEMTSECKELLNVMRSDHAHAIMEDFSMQIITLKKEFSPILKSLRAYARAQKT